MRKSRFTEEQMVKILREADAKPIAEVAKKHGVSEQTIYVSFPVKQTLPKETPPRVEASAET